MNASTLELSKETSSLREKGDFKDDDILLDRNYIDQSFSFMKDALQKGFDVAQLPNGDVMVTETKVVTYHYNWNEERRRFERTNAGARRQRKTK